MTISEYKYYLYRDGGFAAFCPRGSTCEYCSKIIKIRNGRKSYYHCDKYDTPLEGKMFPWGYDITRCESCRNEFPIIEYNGDLSDEGIKTEIKQAALKRIKNDNKRT